jgi:hypothetical protein
MTLSAQQIVDTRRYMGYSLSGDMTSQSFREQVYSDATAFGSLSLDYRLAHLSAEEESTVINYYLANLYLREAEIQGAASNLDTDVAAVWTHNKQEVSDRMGLFNQLRRDLCDFLGFSPGRALAGLNRLMRA